MSKSSHPRQLADNEAMALVRNLRVSPQKLNLVAKTIRGMSVADALRSLSFSRKRIALEVKKAVQSAIANAENNHQLDVDSLKVKEAYVGKAFVMKRIRFRARGRTAKILKPFSRLTIIVHEPTAEENEAQRAKKDNRSAEAKAKNPATNMATKKDVKETV